MTEIGTLKELNVKPGDVVEYVISGDIYTIAPNKCLIHPNGYIAWYPFWGTCYNFRLISRASEIPKLWRDMTDAEKGALLLAHHEGKVIEYFIGGCGWMKCPAPIWSYGHAYRVKPEPKRVTVPLLADFKEIGTIDLVDGKPDLASIKLDWVE